MRMDKGYFWFRLFKTRGIGPKILSSVAKTLEANNLDPEVLSLDRNDLSEQAPKLAKILKEKIREEDTEKVSTDYEQLRKQGIDIIYPGHPDFPPQLLDIAPILFVKGEKKRLTSDSATIVGARDVSAKGVRITRNLAGELAGKGINIVSGYAKGVDSEAHLGALEAKGTTTLVLPNGINQLRQKNAFKKFNWDRDVLAVSQFDPDTKWQAWNAMERNKLVCALSKAVVVIESGPEQDAQGKMSGTFNTAKAALDLNLPLFVVNPDCLDNPPAGNEALIKLGGYSLDPVNGVEAITKHIFVETEEPTSIENQNSTEQLPLPFENSDMS